MCGDIERVLAETFRVKSFRVGQREAVEAVLSGRDAIVVMPTGSGKSLCYQLPALLMPGTTLVVSPLISLMKDQTDALASKGVAVTALNSAVPREEMSRRLDEMRRGGYKLVYVAPERFRNDEFNAVLAATEVSMVVIDEAHCISQWGHDFRPDYLEVGRHVSSMDGIRIMALTATATPAVRRDVAERLGFGGSRPEPFVEVLGFSRPNLHLSVVECGTDRDKERNLLRLIGSRGKGIVYVATRKHAQSVYDLLRKRIDPASGADVLMYHAALPEAVRTSVQREFMDSPNPVIVATTAFGMGIDRADIRFVAHWDIPGGIEQYYQEIGRAGRDGKPAECVLLYRYADLKVQEWFVDGANPDVDTAVRVWRYFKSFGGREVPFDSAILARTLGVRNAIMVNTVVNVLLYRGCLCRSASGLTAGCKADLRTADTEVVRIFEERAPKRERDRERLDAMRMFAYTTRCRHRYILDYFGDQSGNRVCGGCDNCDERARLASISARNPWRPYADLASSLRYAR